MIRLIAWGSIILGIATLLGTSKVIKDWQLTLSFNTSSTGGQVFLFVLGLFLLICGIIQVVSQMKLGK